MIYHVPPQHPHQQGKRATRMMSDSSRSDPLQETNSLCNELSAEAERDKSHPYAVRQMPTLSQLVEDTTKQKECF